MWRNYKWKSISVMKCAYQTNYFDRSLTGKWHPCFFRFFCQRFFAMTLTIHKTASEIRVPSSFFFSTPTDSQRLRHLLRTVHLKWSSGIFNPIECTYQAASGWDLSTSETKHLMIVNCILVDVFKCNIDLIAVICHR